MSSDRPENGSDRGKRAYLLYALIRVRPGISPPGSEGPNRLG